MRKRGKRAPNDSESTGKVGHRIPSNQPAPIQPVYPPPDFAKDPGSGSHSLKHPDRLDPEDHPEDDFDRSAVDDLAVARVEDPQAPERAGAEDSTSASAAPAVETPASGSRGYVVLAIGLPGSGKSTWFRRRGVTPLSSDMLRGILFDNQEEQRFQSLVFSTLRSLLRARLIARMPWNYVDATNLSPHDRRQWIKMAKSFGYESHAVFFDVPCEICIERNLRRERVVDEAAMRKMAERLRPPSFKEGFSKITLVRVKGAAPARPEEPFA